MKIIGLIPARGGSKTIFKKNIKNLGGKPLIVHTIEAALKCSSINRVIVSTDDPEISQIAIDNNAEVPFLRPSILATDTTPDRPVILHLIKYLTEKERYNTDLIIYLRPTTPFKTSVLINKCISKIISNPDLTSLRTVNKVEGTSHPYWMFKEEKGVLKPFIKGIDISKYYQRQLLPRCFRINSVVDIIKPEIALIKKNLYGNKIGFFETNSLDSIDIDTEFDFELCEFILKKYRLNKKI